MKFKTLLSAIYYFFSIPCISWRLAKHLALEQEYLEALNNVVE